MSSPRAVLECHVWRDMGKTRGLKDRKPFTQRVVQQATNVRLQSVVALKVDPFRVYAVGAASVPLLEVPLGLTFWYDLLDSQRLFVKFRDILETKLSEQRFCSWKREEITKGQIVRLRSMEDHILVLAAVNFSLFTSASN